MEEKFIITNEQGQFYSGHYDQQGKIWKKKWVDAYMFRNLIEIEQHLAKARDSMGEIWFDQNFARFELKWIMLL